MMRLLEVVVLASILAGTASGCSRLTFVKPSSKMVRVAEQKSDYSVSDSAATKQRLRVQDRLALASQRLRSGDLVTAEREARAVLKAQPGSADAYLLLAVIMDYQGKVPEAGAYYKRAAELAPTDGSALNNYGAWLCTNGSPAEALVWFDRALKDPRYATPASAWPMRGLRLKGDVQRAGRDIAAPWPWTLPTPRSGIHGGKRIPPGRLFERGRSQNAMGCTRQSACVRTGSNIEARWAKRPPPVDMFGLRRSSLTLPRPGGKAAMKVQTSWAARCGSTCQGRGASADAARSRHESEEVSGQ